MGDEIDRGAGLIGADGRQSRGQSLDQSQPPTIIS
jgi:hypothetical protein